MHRNSLLLFEKYGLPTIGGGAKVLEVGPGGHPSAILKSIAAAGMVVNYAGCDAFRGGRIKRALERAKPTPGAMSLRFVEMPGPYQIAAGNGEFDVVVAANVLAHVDRPWKLVPEMARVLAPGGYLILVTTVTWRYAPVPVDCWRIFSSGLRVLVADAGLIEFHTSTECLDETDVDRERQMNAGRVVDSVAIGQKPAR